MRWLHVGVGRPAQLHWVLVMLLALCLILCAHAVLSSAANPNEASNTKASGKEGQLSEFHRQLIARSRHTPIVNITADDYQKFFSQKGRASSASERDPHILLLITVTDRARCPICVHMTERFQEIQQGYFLDYPRQKHDMLFLMLEYNSQSRYIPGNLGLQSLPAVVIFRGFNRDKSVHLCRPSEQDIAQCITQFTGSKMRYHGTQRHRRLSQQQTPPEPSYLTNHLLTLICFASLFGAYSILKAYFNAKRLKMLAMFIAMGVYFCNFGGTVFDILHDTSLFYTHRLTKQRLFIAPDPRKQYVLEGYMASLTVFSFAFAFVFLHHLVQSAVQTPASQQEQPHQLNNNTTSSSSSSKPQEPAEEEGRQSSQFSFFTVVLPIFIVMVISFLFLHIMYLAKQPSYLAETFLRSMFPIPIIRM